MMKWLLYFGTAMTEEILETADILEGTGMFSSTVFYNNFTKETEKVFSDSRWQFVYKS
jgi:hypothetical protein